MDEMAVAERVLRDQALPPHPAQLTCGQSWPVAWHQIDGFAEVLFVQRSPYIARCRRPRFDLLVAQLAAEGTGPFVCEQRDRDATRFLGRSVRAAGRG